MIKRFATSSKIYTPTGILAYKIAPPLKFSFCKAQQTRENIFRIMNDHGINSKEYQSQMNEFSQEMNSLFQQGNILEGIKYYKINIELI